MSKTNSQNARKIQNARRDHETTALMWLGVADHCDRSQVGARECALALASLAMDAADACVIDATDGES